MCYYPLDRQMVPPLVLIQARDRKREGLLAKKVPLIIINKYQYQGWYHLPVKGVRGVASLTHPIDLGGRDA